VSPLDGEPAAGERAGGDLADGHGGDVDELRAEDVVVLDVELDAGGGVRDLDAEVLLPPEVLRVWDHAGLRDGGAGEADGHVGSLVMIFFFTDLPPPRRGPLGGAAERSPHAPAPPPQELKHRRMRSDMMSMLGRHLASTMLMSRSP
jgi:hypothetical protein